ncbi:MAG: hypothetical protein ACOH1L_00550 [Thermomonas sp.]
MNKEHVEMGEAEMRMALRGLRRDIEPGSDLWPGIAARLQSHPQQSGQAPRTSRPSWLWPFAMAASLLLAVGLAWQIKPLEPATDGVPGIAQASPATTPAVTKSETLVQREADSMTIHYESALREMELQPLAVGWQPGLDALDRSAIEIRTAIQHDPNSRLLLERLRATYTRRLVLARRALYA